VHWYDCCAIMARAEKCTPEDKFPRSHDVSRSSDQDQELSFILEPSCPLPWFFLLLSWTYISGGSDINK